MSFHQIKVGEILRIFRLVGALLNRVFNQIRRRNHIGRVFQIDIRDVDRIGQEGDFVILNLSSNIAAAAQKNQLPGFICIRNRISSAFLEISVFLNKINCKIDTVSCRSCSFGN